MVVILGGDGMDLSTRTPDMSIDVSLGEFHRTHDSAYAAEKLIAKGMAKLTTPQLRDVLSKLNVAQSLSDAETGDDSMFASDYQQSIKLVEAELKKRKKSA